MKRLAASKLGRFIEARLTPGGELGLHLTAGLALMVLAVTVFGEIAEDVTEQDTITVIDLHISRWFHVHAVEPLTSMMLFISHLHGVAGTIALSLLLGLYFHLRKAPYWLLTLAVAVPGGMLLNVLLKYVYQRARPTFEEPLLTLTTYSFPSGHTAAATLFYGVVACYAVMTWRSWSARTLAVVFTGVMVALVATSRVYLGVHYPSDVMAAFVESCGWLAVCITAFSTLRRRRAARIDQ